MAEEALFFLILEKLQHIVRLLKLFKREEKITGARQKNEIFF